MAEIVTIDGQQYKKRSPWGAWGLLFLTILVYGFVWYYKINKEAKQYLQDDSIKPGLSVLALFVPIVNWISVYRTGERITRMEDKAGVTKTIEPILGVLGSILYSLHVPYYQGHLNKVWDAAVGKAASAPAAGPPNVPPPPPA
jgi:hypothetical protein